MTLLAARPDLERFRDAIAARLGLYFDDSRMVFLGEVLERRLTALGQSSHAYLDRLNRTPPPGELARLAGELTVGETYFFRNGEQFRALAERVLPERLAARTPPGPLRLISAACATGEEAYSIAITAREALADAGLDKSWDIRVRGVDINPAALARAAAGRYSPWALRDTPSETRRKWFRPQGREQALDEDVRRSVRFDARNLLGDEPDLWPPGFYDVIFCRNVLMYFAPAQMQRVVERMTQALAPGGFLFLGHVETLRGISDAFELCHTHDTFYYRRKTGGTAIAWNGADRTPAPLPEIDGSWFDAISAASDRVAALMAGKTPVPAFDPPGPDTDSADALDALLLEAARRAQNGEPAAAESAARALLARDGLNAGAHYVLALCREQKGDAAGAAEHDRIAAYLDPLFAMPRLHLGLICRQAGDAEAGRRELGQALILLKREDAARILLFGGGFGRDALIRLCRSALIECGGRP